MIHFEREVELRSPIMIAAFRGWNDAGDAATHAAEHLGRTWGSERFATIDPEEFYDFQSVRPQVRLEDGMTRRIDWPSNEFFAAHVEGSHRDAIILVGTEPNLRWRTFTRFVVDVAQRHDVELVITLGALLADVPHSRPVQITGTAGDQRLVEELGLQRSRYEGPTGIVGVLHDACAAASLDSASLWAAVPHYVAVTPNPKAALALVNKASQLLGIDVGVDDLQSAAASYEHQVSDLVATDEDVQAYVRLLEERTDEQAREPIDPSELPSGDALAAELENFLRRRNPRGEL